MMLFLYGLFPSRVDKPSPTTVINFPWTYKKLTIMENHISSIVSEIKKMFTTLYNAIKVIFLSEAKLLYNLLFLTNQSIDQTVLIQWRTELSCISALLLINHIWYIWESKSSAFPVQSYLGQIRKVCITVGQIIYISFLKRQLKFYKYT